MSFKHIKSDYPSLNLPNITFGNRRFYKVPSGFWYPSVTTVTGFAKEGFFKEWRNTPSNMKNYDEAIRRGNSLHETVEKYIKNDEAYSNGLGYYDSMIFQLVKKYVDKIQNIRLQEKTLYSDSLRIAGRCDCIADYEGVLSVIDFKGSNKIKTKDDIQDYFSQTTCYAKMWNEQSVSKIKKIVIIMATDEGTGQVFEESIVNYEHILDKKIEHFWSKNDFDELQRNIKNSTPQ